MMFLLSVVNRSRQFFRLCRSFLNLTQRRRSPHRFPFALLVDRCQFLLETLRIALGKFGYCIDACKLQQVCVLFTDALHPGQICPVEYRKHKRAFLQSRGVSKTLKWCLIAPCSAMEHLIDPRNTGKFLFLSMFFQGRKRVSRFPADKTPSWASFLSMRGWSSRTSSDVSIDDRFLLVGFDSCVALPPASLQACKTGIHPFHGNKGRLWFLYVDVQSTDRSTTV